MHKRGVGLGDVECPGPHVVGYGEEDKKGHFKVSSRRTKIMYLTYFVAFILALVVGVILSPSIFRLGSYAKTWYIEWRLSEPVNEFESIAEGFRKNPLEPFVVRKASDFKHIPLSLAKKMMNEHPKWQAFGNAEDGSKVFNLTLKTILRDFQNDNLSVTIFESPLDMFILPHSLKINHELASFEKNDPNYVLLFQTPIFSRADYLSNWHMDPTSMGGGWMYLWTGYKEWKFQAPWVAPLYYTEDPAWDQHLRDLSLTELDAAIKDYRVVFPLFNAALGEDSPSYPFKISPVKLATVGPGDFVYFPPGWLHRVHTTPEKAMGIGGYIRPPPTVPFVERVNAYFSKLGINGTWNERDW